MGISTLNLIAVSLILLVFEFHSVAWFLIIGIFPSYCVPFPPQNMRKLQPPQFCSLQSIVEKCMFRKKSAPCCFQSVILSRNLFWDFYYYYFVTSSEIMYGYVPTVSFFPLMASLVTLACDYWLLLHLLAFLRRVQFLVFMERVPCIPLSLKFFPFLYTLLWHLLMFFFNHILQVLTSEFNKDKLYS